MGMYVCINSLMSVVVIYNIIKEQADPFLPQGKHFGALMLCHSYETWNLGKDGFTECEI